MKKTILAAALILSSPAIAQDWQSYPAQPAQDHQVQQTQGAFPSYVMQAASSLKASSPTPVPGPVPARLLRMGDRGHDVTWLANALAVRGYHLPPQPQEQPLLHAPTGEFSHATNHGHQGLWEGELVFDAHLEHLVRQYQSDKGLAVDGVAGPRVIESLTRDDAALARGLEAWASAIEGWRHQALAAGHDKFIVVNIPSYTLHAFNAHTGERIMESRVVVGASGSRTPRFATNIVNLKFNPDWTPTPSMRGKRYAPPGPNNPLGRVRFSTDNNMHIYLHDTNSPSLFSRHDRAMSLGCVRVEQWAALAGWVAGRDQQWIDEMTPSGRYRTQHVKVSPVPVVMAYSLVDLAENAPSVYSDVYGLGSRAIGYSALFGGTATPDMPSISR